MYGFQPDYSAKGIAEDFIPAFTKIASEIKVGDLSDPETAIGPIISDKQVEELNFTLVTPFLKGQRLCMEVSNGLATVVPPRFYLVFRKA